MAGNLMIQGTMSNAGKSLLTAGILRVLKQDGFRAAPFKSQNMALNSYITKDGLEMGRAQVMQAEAAGIEPSVCMNPILLKPTSDVGSQVIVSGRVRGNYTAREYFRMKKDLIPDILSAYEELKKQTDIIVIEGAGSPAEINLKADDIVNMGLAGLVDAPVLLVGDIDRGGVFAQLLGTVSWMDEEERRRVKGFIINKFRGDEKLLSPGPEMLYERCGIPTIGVLPYLNLTIDDEDSLSEQLEDRKRTDRAAGRTAAGEDMIRIAVIRLPHLSNFTDLTPLTRYAFVSLRYVDSAAQIERADGIDLIVLPGTKNTIRDMEWLRDSGLEAAIRDKVSAGCRLIGICGGYQMLGGRITDETGSEGGGDVRGMGLLPITTAFTPEKRRTRIKGTVCGMPPEWRTLAGLSVDGYEIHMGESRYHADGAPGTDGGGSVPEMGNTGGCAPFSILSDGRADGCAAGRVLGTYLHGLLETDEFTGRLLLLLGVEKGLDRNRLEKAIADTAAYHAFKESQYDLLADAVRKHVDMERIYEIIGARKS